MIKRYSRRELARTFGAASIFLAPVLRQTRAWAQPPVAKRAECFVFMSQTNGYHPQQAFRFDNALAPLAPNA